MSHRLLNEFKKYAELDVSVLDKDDKISLALEAAEGLIATRYGILILETVLTETFDGDGTDLLFVTHLINTLSSVTIGDDTNSDTSPKYNMVRLTTGSFTSGFDNVVVEYIAGYADTDIPSQLKLAMFKLTDKFYTDADEARDGVSGFQTNTKTGIDYVIEHMPTSFEILVAPYRVIAL